MVKNTLLCKKEGSNPAKHLDRNGVKNRKNVNRNIKTTAMALPILVNINYNRTIVIVDSCNNFVGVEKYFIMQD
jgi:hypothetical protein